MARRLPAAVRAVKGSKSVAFQTRWYDAEGNDTQQPSTPQPKPAPTIKK